MFSRKAKDLMQTSHFLCNTMMIPQTHEHNALVNEAKSKFHPKSTIKDVLAGMAPRLREMKSNWNNYWVT